MQALGSQTLWKGGVQVNFSHSTQKYTQTSGSVGMLPFES